MDISVIIPSRKRVRGLSAMLTSMHMLESGKHKVTYGVACDDDDELTVAFCRNLQNEFPLAYNVGEGRPESLGGIVNIMADKMPADVYTALGDDMLCMSPNWDEIIAEAVKIVPHGVFWWKNVYPEEATCAIVTDKWRKAAGSIFTNHYPFWFDDLCLLELWAMTTESEVLVLDCKFADRPKRTHRMRDLAFWRNFFTATRDLRIEQSFHIAEKLGLPKPTANKAMAAQITSALEGMTKEQIEKIENNQGEVNFLPDENYIKTKLRAEKILNVLGQEVKHAA